MPKPLRVLHSTKPYAQHDQDADAAGVVRLKPLNLTVRLSELVASLSIGTDIGMGQPEGQALRTCHLALAVAREMGSIRSNAPTSTTSHCSDLWAATPTLIRTQLAAAVMRWPCAEPWRR